MRLPLDQNLPKPLIRLLVGHAADHASDLGWGDFPNGEFVAVADAAGYDVLLTADRNLRYQQNLASRRIGLVVTSTNLWPELRAGAEHFVDAIGRAGPGAYAEVQVPRRPLRRRPPPPATR